MIPPHSHVAPQPEADAPVGQARTTGGREDLDLLVPDLQACPLAPPESPKRGSGNALSQPDLGSPFRSRPRFLLTALVPEGRKGRKATLRARCARP